MGTREYEIEIVDGLAPQRSTHIAAVLGGFGAEIEPRLWRCFLTDVERDRLAARFAGEILMGDGLDIAAVETLMPVDTSAGIAAIRPTRSNLISAPDELL